MARPSLRLLVQNSNGFGKHKSAVLAPLLSSSFDVMFLVETWFVDHSYILSLPSFVAHSPLVDARAGQRQLNGILCLASRDTIPHIKNVSTTKYAIHMTIRGYRVSCVYLPPSLDRAEFENVINSCSASHVVVGDFNAIFGPPYCSKSPRPPDRLDLLRRWSSSNGLHHLIPTAGSATTDHIFSRVGGSFLVEPARIQTDHTALSAVVPLPAHLCLDSIKSKAKRRFHVRKLADEDYCAMLVDSYNAKCKIFDVKMADFRLALVTLSVAQRLDKISELEQLMVWLITESCEDTIGSYAVCEARQRKEPLVEPDDIASNIKAFKRSFRPVAIPLESATANLSITEDISRHYNSIFGKTKIHPNSSNDRFVRSDWLTKEQSELLGIGDMSYVESLFTRNRVDSIIDKYSAAKSCGADGVHISILKKLRPSLVIDQILSLFQVMWITGLTPNSWNTATLHPLPKSANTKTIEECRPISLTQTLRRLFEKILHKHLVSLPELKLNRCQAGFRRGHSTITQAAISNDIGAAFPNTKRAFIDFRAAYDSVPLHLLFKKLENRRTPSVALSLIMSLFSDCSLKVGYKDLKIPTIKLKRGLLQGSILSPLLFNVFVDDLADALEGTDDFVGCLLYADDLELLARTEMELQEKLDVVHRWCVENGMECNLRKCAVFVDYPLYIGLERVPVTSTYKYLGIAHKARFLDLEAHVGNLCRSANATLLHAQVACAGLPEKTKLAIFKTFIRPKLEYGAPLLRVAAAFKPAILAQLQEIMKRSIIWIIPHFGTNTQTGGITKACSLLGLLDVGNRLEYLAAKFIDSLEGSPPGSLMSTLRIWRSAPWPERMLVPRLKISSLHTRWKQDAAATKTKMETIQKNWQVECAYSRSEISRLVAKNCWNRSGVDYVFGISDANIRKAAIHWRLGLVFSLAQCPQSIGYGSAHRINRGCVNSRDCNLAQYLPEHIQRIQLVRPSLECPHNYSTLDQLLNDGNTVDFFSAYKAIESITRAFH